MSQYPKLDEYIKDARARGVEADQLKKEMIEAGYNEEDIKQSLSNISANDNLSTDFKSTEDLSSIPDNKKNLSNIIIIFLVATIIILAVFYIWKYGVFAEAPYNQDNLFTGLAEKISEIETASYSFSGSFVGMDREDGAEPFIAIGNTKDLKEKYYRDYQRSRFVSDFVNKIRRSPNSILFSSLENIGSGVSVYDPLTNELYDYKLTENGQNFELAITFETEAAIKEARDHNKTVSERELRSNSIYNVGGPYTINEKTIIFTKDTRPLYLSSRPPQNIYEAINENIEMVPKDINAKLSFDAKSNIVDDNVDLELNLSADGDLGDITYKVDVDFIKKSEDYYVKINNFPSMFLMFMPFPKDEWILLSEEYTGIENYLIGSEIYSEPQDDQKFKETLATVLRSADRNQLLKFTKKPQKDNLNGKVVYKYDIQINGDGLEPFLQDIMSEIRNSNYDNFGDEHIVELENMIEYVNGDDFKSVLEYYTKNTKNILWVDSDGFPVKVESINRLVPSSDKLFDRQFLLTLSMSLLDINKETKIEAPQTYKTIEEIEESMYNPLGEARAKGTDAMIKANINNIRAQAELIYDQVGGYGTRAFSLGPCKNEEGTLFANDSVYGALMAATEDNLGKATCVSQTSGGIVNSWAISAPLVTDPDYSYCVDSKGTAMEILGSLKGSSCNDNISKKKDNYTETQTLTINKTPETETVTEEFVEGESNIEKARDKFIYDIEKEISECYELFYDDSVDCFNRLEEEFYESQKKFTIGSYDFCDKKYDVQKRSFNDFSNNINISDIAKTYSDLANKEERGLFCDEFEGFFSNNKVGIAVENFLTEPDGYFYKEIRFYKLFDRELLMNSHAGFTTSLDLLNGDVKYIPEINPGEFRTEMSKGGYYTESVLLGNIK